MMRASALVGAAAVLAACASAPLRASAPTGTEAERAVVAPGPPPNGDTVSTHSRSVTRVGTGVYMIRHEDAPDTFPQGNTTVVIGERDVLVVDSCYLPSSAQRDIAQIRAWTDRPVKYLVNTHWHYDHTMGNGAYRDAFPGIAIVAHAETKKQIAGYNRQWFANFPERGARFRRLIDAGKDEAGKPLSPSAIAELQTGIAGITPVWAELRPLAARRDLAPDVSFRDELAIDLGGREVRVLHLGRGNTAGDVVVHLADEKLLIAGDLVDHPVPYLGGGYPVELVATLENIARLAPETIVPGHGNLIRGSAYLELVTALVRTVVALVDEEIHRLGNGAQKLELVRKAVEKRIDLLEWHRRFAIEDAEAREMFDDFSFPGLVTAAYAELWPR